MRGDVSGGCGRGILRFMGADGYSCTVRRKYAAGGDVWLADATSFDEAREMALKESLRFEHGAVYVARRKGAQYVVGACYAAGLPSRIEWWITPPGGVL